MLNKVIKNQLLQTLEKIRYGSLFLSMPDGTDYYFEGKESGPYADLYIQNWSALKELAFRGDVGFADSYRLGLWETSSLEPLFYFAMVNEDAIGSLTRPTALSRIFAQLGYLSKLNTLKGSKRNIEEHYDLGNDFYSIWLDPSMTYSSAIYSDECDELQSAQLNKYDRLISRLDNQSGSILEIGCGWGGFAERIATRTNCQLKGLTLSKQQHDYASDRLSGQAEFQLEDYRMERGVYDNIVSIEMFEAVGIQYWKQYFNQVRSCLKPGGKALIQSIVIDDGRFERYKKGSDMIRSYIFPGGMLPSDSQFTMNARECGLKLTDKFKFGKDYARTLRNWLVNFDGAAPEIKELGFDDGFLRLWRYYLASCAAAFKKGNIDVVQYELAHG